MLMEIVDIHGDHLTCIVWAQTWMNVAKTSDAISRHGIWSTSFQMKVCRMFGGKHYLNQTWFIVDWATGNEFQWKQ